MDFFFDLHCTDAGSKISIQWKFETLTKINKMVKKTLEPIHKIIISTGGIMSSEMFSLIFYFYKAVQ